MPYLVRVSFASKYVIAVVFFAGLLVIASVLCHFNLEKHQSYLAFGFLNSVDLFY